ncbi:PepSY domain-containing protein [Thalassospira lucentensis]|uniref:PepSY domain-containing protein n=1 Tax=Thalassospira lucentensis TaxID=168935 RepID=UPI0034C6CF63
MKRTVFPTPASKSILSKSTLSAAIAFALLTAASLGVASSPAHADDDMCNVPKADWKTKEALREKLTAEGWDVRKVKTEDGCFEVYAIDAKGKKVEAYFNPATFDTVKIKQED